MDGIEGIISSKLAMDNLKLSLSVQTNLLKKEMELQEEIMRILLQSMGIGGNIDIAA
ncbi:MAG: hypothetical protein NZ900_01965 [Synergistetes bacterium]|nr:hypothetical protein [Synergistota bacterium]MDW8191694.1 hypothetical protein [Synergistota bacterium]